MLVPPYVKNFILLSVSLNKKAHVGSHVLKDQSAEKQIVACGAF